jgi:hypothetical protein
MVIVATFEAIPVDRRPCGPILEPVGVDTS